MGTLSSKTDAAQRATSAKLSESTGAGNSDRDRGMPATDLRRIIGNRSLQQLLQGAALKVAKNPTAGVGQAQVLATAERGVRNADRPLPHLDRVQAAFGREHDFSAVRVRIGGPAADAGLRIGASAYTLGERIAFAREPDVADVAHEAAHVIQQRRGLGLTPGLGPVSDRHEHEADRAAHAVAAGGSIASWIGPAPPMRTWQPHTVQRRLIATGTDIASFIALVEPAIGVQLSHDPATNEITAIGSLIAPATSPALETTLLGIINDPLQDAEINFGAHQTRVAVGAYPAAGRVQQIDMDDILAIEAGAPGSGIAKLGHEINENYTGHAGAPVGGMAPFGPAHSAGEATESAVASDLVMSGNRVASVDVVRGPGSITRVQDFENYYLVFDRDRPAPNDSVLSNARQAAKVLVATHAVDQFATGSDVVPGAGAATTTLAAADVAANPSATVLIEGFTDNVGTPANNVDLSRRRAANARADLEAAGVNSGRIHHVGRGAVGFVATNATAAGRASNRRIVISVTRPGP
jgi:outer membrane protein OmpA-like peptidoglycan-associated protein